MFRVCDGLLVLSPGLRLRNAGCLMNKFVRFFTASRPLPLFILMVAPYGVFKMTDLGSTPAEWGFLVAYFLLVMLGWIYAIGMSANDRLAPEFRLSARLILLFRIALAVPFVCLAYFVTSVLNPLYSGELSHPPGWMIYVNFVALFSIFFCIWFAARQFSMLRLGREPGFIDYYPTFMALWFCFIGVWFVQKSVIEQFSKTDETPS